MTPTKEQQAQEYADAKVKENYGSESNFEWMHIKQAYSDGYTACEQSMWRSVEEELPEDDETVLTYSNYGPFLAYYSKQDKMWFVYGSYGDINPTHWMPLPELPSLPDTNTEKK